MTPPPFRWSNSLHQDNDPSCILRKYPLKKVISLIEQGTYVQVLAPVQFGRTTFAMQLVDALVHTGSGLYPFLPVLIRCLHVQGDDFKAVQNAIAEALLKVASEFLPQEQYRKVGRLLQYNLNNSTYKFRKTLMEINKNTDRCDFVLIFDDLETLEQEILSKTLSLLRSLHEYYSENRSKAPYRVVILSSRNLTHEVPLANSPFNVSDLTHLPPFSRAELDSMLADMYVSSDLNDIHFNDRALDRILQESGGHPYLIQRLCQIMIEVAGWPDITGNRKELTDKDVARACFRLMEKGDRNLLSLNTITDQQQEWHLCKRLIKGEKIRYQAIQREISLLSAKGIVEEDKGFCHFPVNLYRSCLTNLCFNEQFSDHNYAIEFEEWQQVLLSFFAVQQILLNNALNHQIHSMEKNENIIELLKKNVQINLGEMNVFLKYYGYEEQVDNKLILAMIEKWFALVINTQRGDS